MSVNLPKQAYFAALVKACLHYRQWRVAMTLNWACMCLELPCLKVQEANDAFDVESGLTRLWLAGWRCPSFSCVPWYILSQLLPLGCPHLTNIAGSGTSCLQSKWHHCHSDALKNCSSVKMSPMWSALEEKLWSVLAWSCSVCERWWCGEFSQGCVHLL